MVLNRGRNIGWVINIIYKMQQNSQRSEFEALNVCYFPPYFGSVLERPGQGE